jgi:CDP-diglyceride synthetase
VQTFGRTPLTNISPKKTWEGTIIGFCGCIVTSVVLSKVFSWPLSSLRYTLLLLEVNVSVMNSICLFAHCKITCVIVNH